MGAESSARAEFTRASELIPPGTKIPRGFHARAAPRAAEALA
jgi:hypothetical protein